MKSFIGCHWKTWAIFLAVWTLLGIFFSTQILIAYSYAGQRRASYCSGLMLLTKSPRPVGTRK